MDVRTLVAVWLCLGASIMGFALYATVRELWTPRDRALEGGSPLNAPTGQGFLPRPGIRSSDGSVLRFGKALRCMGWYALAVALAGFAVGGFADPQERLLFSLTMYAVYSAVGLLLVGSVFAAIGARTR